MSEPKNRIRELPVKRLQLPDLDELEPDYVKWQQDVLMEIAHSMGLPPHLINPTQRDEDTEE